MVRIPTQDEQQVQPAPLPTPFISDRTIRAATRRGAIIAESIADVSATVGKTSLLLARRASATRVQSALNDLRENELELEFGDPEDATKVGFRNVKGIDANEAQRQASDELKRRRDAIADGIPKQRDRETFLRDSHSRFVDFQRNGLRHAMTESDKAALIERQTAKANAMEEALGHLADYDTHPETALPDFFGAMGRWLAQSKVSGKELGIPDSALKLEGEDFTSALLRSGIESLIKQGKASVATEIYKQTRDPHIQPSDEKEIDPTIQPANDREEGRAEIAVLFEGMGEDFTAEDFKKVNDRIASENSPIKAAAMQSAADRRFAVKTTTKALRDKQTVMRLWNEAPADPDHTRLDTDAGFLALDDKDQTTVKRRYKLLAKGREFPETMTRADWEHVQGEWTFEYERDASGTIVSQTRRTLQYQADFDLTLLMPYTTETEWKSLRREQNSAIAALASSSTKSPSAYGTAHQRMTELLNQLPEAQRKMLTDDPATMGVLDGLVRRGVETMRADPERKGREASGPDLDEMLGRILVGDFSGPVAKFDTVTETNYFDSTEPVFLAKLLDLDDEKFMALDNVELTPQQERLTRDALRFRHGTEPTAEQVRIGFAQAELGNDEEISQFLDEAVAGELPMSGISDISTLGIDPAIVSEVRQYALETGRDVNDPDTWSAMFSEAAKTLRPRPGPRRAPGHTDEQIVQAGKRMIIASLFYRGLREGGMSDEEAIERLGLLKDGSPFAKTEPAPVTTQGAANAK